MAMSQSNRTPLSSWGTWKVILLFFVVLGLLCGAGWIFLNKGLYLLPDQMCEGTLKRDTVEQVLPRTQSADNGSHSRGAGAELTISCHVTTSNDSSLYGNARVQPTSLGGWLEYYRGSGDQNRIIRVSVGDIEALTQINSSAATSSVYLPCVPPGVPSYNASQPYAVIAEAQINGSVISKGVPLRQTLTDFAYQLAEHSYKLAKCKAARDFPAELPRYKES